jgi:adenylylsulfate kinase-like enzyme
MPKLPVLWLYGLPNAGKTTLSRAVAESLYRQHWLSPVLVDGGECRGWMSSDLGFSPNDRETHHIRMARYVNTLHRAGIPVVAASIAPTVKTRAYVSGMMGDDVCWVYLDCDGRTREAREPRKGLTKSEIDSDGLFEPPTREELQHKNRHLIIPTHMSIGFCRDCIVGWYLKSAGLE